MLSRNCALTPRQVAAFYLSLVIASACIASVFLYRRAFDPRATRVAMEDRPRGQVAVVARGQLVTVGRSVCERERRRFAGELRRALLRAA